MSSLVAGASARLRLAGVLGLGQLAGRGALAVALLVLARALPVEAFGDLALLLAVVAVMAAIADAGFGRLLVRDVARADRSAPAVVRELMRARSVAVAVVVLVSAVALAVAPGMFPVEVTILGLAYLSLEATAYGFESAAVGAERPWRFVAAQSVAAAVLLLGVTALALADTATLTSAMAVLVGTSLTKVTGHLVAWRWSHRTFGVTARRSMSKLLGEALPFLGLTLLATVYYRVGIVALYAIAGATETASYAAAFRIVDVVAIVAGLAFASMSPTLSRAHRDRPDAVWALWRRGVTVIALATVPFALLTWLAAEPLCGLLFGAPYRESAGEDLRMLVPGISLMVPQALSAAVVFMANEHKAILRLTAVNVFFCVIASVTLADLAGSEGAALALSLSEAVSFVTFAALIRRSYGPARNDTSKRYPYRSDPEVD